MIAILQRHHFEELYLSLAGIIFVGGPFQGSDAASVGQWLAQLFWLDTTLLKLLGKHSQDLHDLSSDFFNSYQDLDIVCFYEKQKTSFGPLKTQVRLQNPALTFFFN